MSQRVTYLNMLLLGVDNVRRKLELSILGEDNQTKHQAWLTPQQIVLSIAIIESWLQQNILLKNNSVGLYQKGSFTAGFGPTVCTLDRHGCERTFLFC